MVDDEGRLADEVFLKDGHEYDSSDHVFSIFRIRVIFQVHQIRPLCAELESLTLGFTDLNSSILCDHPSEVVLLASSTWRLEN